MTFTDYLHTQPLLLVVVSFIIGIIAGDGTVFMVPGWLWTAMAALSVMAFVVCGKFPVGQSVCIYLSFFCIGAALSARACRLVAFPFAENQQLNYEAVITDEPKVRGRTLQCDMAVTAVNGAQLDRAVNVKAAILRDTVDNDWRRLHVGSGVEATSVMQPLENYYPDSNFDYVRWLHVHGFSARTFVYYTDWRIRQVSLKPLSRLGIVRLKALRLRSAMLGKLFSHDDMTERDDQREAVVAAMTLGDKHAISKKTRDDYSISGGSHILALSGLHLSIIYAVLTIFLGRLRHDWLCQALVLSALWMYVMLVGMGASVVRSAVMLSVYSLCLVARRDKASVNTLAFAALCLLAANPLCLWDVGFQMSFMAVLAILVYYNPFYRLLPLHNRLLKGLWGVASVSLAAQLGTAPLVAYYFGRFSSYFLLSNFVVVPAATLILYGAVLLLVASPFPWVFSFAVRAISGIAGAQNAALSFIADLPGACIDNIHLTTLQVYILYIVVVCLTIFMRYTLRLRTLRKLDAFRY